MNDAAPSRSLTGWQRAYVLLAAQYIREIAVKSPSDVKARSVYEALLEVLEPTRRMARQYRERRQATSTGGSMWDQRSGHDRRAGGERRKPETFLPERERRKAQRRGGRDRRARS